jgi:hypothetical protein
MAGKDIIVENMTVSKVSIRLGDIRFIWEFIGGYHYVYVTQFDNEEDTDYYLRKYTAHAECGKTVGPLFRSAQVNYFVPGGF